MGDLDLVDSAFVVTTLPPVTQKAGASSHDRRLPGLGRFYSAEAQAKLSKCGSAAVLRGPRTYDARA